MNPVQTPQQLEACLSKLSAYYPGDWDDQRCAVWAQELAAIPFDAAMTAITAMARAESFPTVAKLLEHAGRAPRSPGGAVVNDDAMFLPGTGWMRRPPPLDRSALPAAEPDTGGELIDADDPRVRSIRSARSIIRRLDDELGS